MSSDGAAPCPPGARVARVFGDGHWYDGTVIEAPWPPGHRWGHWRRVRFDDGETRDIDTDAGPACFRTLDGAPALAPNSPKRQRTEAAPDAAPPQTSAVRLPSAWLWLLRDHMQLLKPR
jgi:hypothetical protein